MVNVILFFGWLYIGVKNLFFKEHIDKLDYFLAWIVAIANCLARIAA